MTSRAPKSGWDKTRNAQGRNMEPPELAARKGVTKSGTDPNKGYTLDNDSPQPAKTKEK